MSSELVSAAFDGQHSRRANKESALNRAGRRRCIMRGGQEWREYKLEHMNANESKRGRMASIFTDIHFWVPAIVLAGGLLLLRFIH